MPTANGTAFRIIGWISSLIAIFTLVWLQAKFQASVTTDINWVKTSLATIVTRFNELDVMKTRMEMLDANGTTAMKETVARLNSFAQKVDAFERNGSPGEVKRMEQIESRMDKLERDVEVHVRTTGKPQ